MGPAVILEPHAGASPAPQQIEPRVDLTLDEDARAGDESSGGRSRFAERCEHAVGYAPGRFQLLRSADVRQIIDRQGDGPMDLGGHRHRKEQRPQERHEDDARPLARQAPRVRMRSGSVFP